MIKREFTTRRAVYHTVLAIAALTLLFDSRTYLLLASESRQEIAGSVPAEPFSVSEEVLSSNIQNLSIRYHDLELIGIRGKLIVSQTSSRYSLLFRDAYVKELRLPVFSLLFPHLLESVQIKGKIAWDRNRPKVSIPDLEIYVPELGDFRLHVEYPLNGETLLIAIRSDRISLRKLTRNRPDLLKNLAVDGRLSLHWRIEKEESGYLRWSGTFTVSEGRFHDPSYYYAGEHIQLRLDTEGSWDSRQEKASAHVALAIRHGEVLADKFYVDLAKKPLFIKTKAPVSGNLDKLTIPALKFSLKNVVSFLVSGRVSDVMHGPRGDLRVVFPSQALKAFLDFFVRNPFSEERSWLKNAVWGGSWKADIRVRNSLFLPVVTARIDILDGALLVPEPHIELNGIKGSIPIWFDPRSDSSVGVGLESSKQYGNISLKSVTTPWISINTVSIPFIVNRNGIRTLRSFSIPFENSSLVIDQIVLHNMWSSSRNGYIRLAPVALDLSPLLLHILDKPVHAKLRGKGFGFSIKGDRIDSTGALLCTLFSGRLEFDRISCTRIFTPGRSFFVDAHWSDIDMEQLTSFTHFGHISGRMKGSLKDFEFSYGAPIAFDLIVESQQTKGVKQRISVTAIDNLTQLGGNQSAFVGSAGLLKIFFKDFAYKKIAIRCTLKNDYFSIRGLIKEKNVEYLVKRRGLNGVNIVNRNPRNRIAWQDMIERLQRIAHRDKVTIQ